MGTCLYGALSCTHYILRIPSVQDLHTTMAAQHLSCLRRLKQLCVTDGWVSVHILSGNGLSFWTGRKKATQQCQMLLEVPGLVHSSTPSLVGTAQRQ